MSMEKYVRDVNGDCKPGFDDYQIVGPIGSGSTGKVVEVLRDGQRYAMKIVSSVDVSSSETFVPDNRNLEMHKAQALKWAHVSDSVPESVVRMVNYDVSPFIWAVMEYADTDLEKAMAEGTVGVDTIVGLLRSLHRIHSAGVVHRDIKPANILRVDGTWKFSDFGLSKSVFDSGDVIPKGAGTPMYMAPEQCDPNRFGGTDVRTDIWQMGIILYRVITGASPYAVQDPEGIIMSVVTSGPMLECVPPKYRVVMNRALNQRKENRFASAEQFADELQKAISGHMRSTVLPGMKPRNAAAAAPVRSQSSGPDVSADDLMLYEGGMRYYKGLGRVPSYRQAYEMFSKSGHPAAVMMTAIMLNQGTGVGKDIVRSGAVLMKAGDLAEQCDSSDPDVLWMLYRISALKMADGKYDAYEMLRTSAEGKSCLGMYEYYLNDAEAPGSYTYLYSAAEAGYAPAILDYGTALEEGRFGNPSLQEAIGYYRRGADQGHVDSELKLFHALAEDYPKKQKSNYGYYKKRESSELYGSLHDYNKGLEYEGEKNYELAADRYRHPNDNDLCQFRLGMLILENKVKPKKDEDGVDILKKSASNGNADALNALGDFCRTGKHMSRSYPDAAEYYKKAAKLGCTDSMISLAYMYLNSQAEPEDPSDAPVLFTAAWRNGDMYGLYSLAMLYMNGNTVIRSKRAAWDLLSLGANGGNGLCMYGIAAMYEEGSGPRKNLDKALYWYRMSELAGYRNATGKVDELWNEAGPKSAELDSEFVRSYRPEDEGRSYKWKLGHKLGIMEVNDGVLTITGAQTPHTGKERGVLEYTTPMPDFKIKISDIDKLTESQLFRGYKRYYVYTITTFRGRSCTFLSTDGGWEHTFDHIFPARKRH